MSNSTEFAPRRAYIPGELAGSEILLRFANGFEHKIMVPGYNSVGPNGKFQLAYPGEFGELADIMVISTSISVEDEDIEDVTFS